MTKLLAGATEEKNLTPKPIQFSENETRCLVEVARLSREINLQHQFDKDWIPMLDPRQPGFVVLSNVLTDKYKECVANR